MICRVHVNQTLSNSCKADEHEITHARHTRTCTWSEVSRQRLYVIKAGGMLSPRHSSLATLKPIDSSYRKGSAPSVVFLKGFGRRIPPSATIISSPYFSSAAFSPAGRETSINNPRDERVLCHSQPLRR